MENQNLNYWKRKAEEAYSKTPSAVLKYISELEKMTSRPIEFVVQKEFEMNEFGDILRVPKSEM